MRRFSLAVIAQASLALVASAQSFNLDAQAWAGDPASLPPASYGGPANSPGLWFSVRDSNIQSGLVTVDGVPAAVSITMAVGCPSGPQACNDPSTSGPEELLLDDYHLCNGSSTEWFFEGLENGVYEITTLVFLPCGAATGYRVVVEGVGFQNVSGTWSGSYVLGGNYTRHTKTVTDGTLYLYVYTPVTVDSAPLNAVQFVRTDEPPPVGTPQCYGDGGGAACPCANTGHSGSGCQNSTGTGGARLFATGSISPDTVVLNAYRELPTSLTIFLQGNATVGPLAFGDGLRCAGGILKRLYNKSASGGAVSAPGAGDPSITARSAALGDPIPPGERRYYQTYYRDSNASFCPAPQGSTFNSSHVVKIVW